jgi:hypothetical protein
MGLDRRTFLQRSSLALLTLGMIDPYLQSLADTIPRKLALLVGVNQYPQTSLNGCHTDVALQKELLIERFGFKSEDVLTLTGKPATKENIETAFREHLIKQASAGDVVVFHFSGYGSQVQLSQSRRLNTLLPSDGIVITDGIIKRNDLLLDTLRLLGRSLSTDKITLVLDTSHTSTPQTLRGGLRLRSLPESLSTNVRSEESARQQLKTNQSLKPSFPGVILAAAQENQIAAEFNWNNFSAGLFTHALTQYLWEITPPRTILFAMRSAAEQIAPIMGSLQQPAVITDNKQALLTYYLPPVQSLGVQGRITAVDSGIVKIELCGLPATILNNIGINSCFTIPDQQEILLPIRARQGIRAETYPIKTVFSPKIGQVVQESIRFLPRNLGLSIALDDSLTRIEKVDATSALSNLYFVSEIVSVSENNADCILLRKNGDTSYDVSRIGYSLSSASGFPVPKSMGIEGEAIKLAVDRLTSKLKTFLAAKLWSLTFNEYSSKLKVSAVLEVMSEDNKKILTKETVGYFQCHKSISREPNNNKYDQIIPSLNNGSKIQYQVSNDSDQPLYCLIVGLEASGTAIALYSPQLNSIPIPSGETLTFPRDPNVNWIINSVLGLEKIQLICSQYPFNKTFEILKKTSNIKEEKEQLIELQEPLKISQQILEDLQYQGQIDTEINLSNNDNYILNANIYASLGFLYQIS